MKHAFPRLTATVRYDAFDLTALMTSLCLLFVAHAPELKFVALVAVVGVLFCQPICRTAWFWLGIAASWWPHLIFNWEVHEDHSYLINYWCLAMGLSLAGRESYATLQTNARLLIGLTFAFGCFWKISSPDFMDGSLNLYNLLFDPRFHGGLASTWGLVPDHVTNVQTLTDVRTGLAPVNLGHVTFEPGLSWLASGLTWWTVLIELALALFFLWPRVPVSKRWKDPALLLFTATTYVFVPVLGFGCLFCAMGAAQCEPRQRRLRLVYGLLALLIIIRGNYLSLYAA